MTKNRKEAKYPENLKIKGQMAAANITSTEMAQRIGMSRHTVNMTINGHYKGQNVVPMIEKELESL